MKRKKEEKIGERKDSFYSPGNCFRSEYHSLDHCVSSVTK